MKENEVEVEIKIEYFDSLEVDPLSDYDQEIKTKDNRLSNIPTQLKKHEDIMDSHSLGNDELNYESNDCIEPENIINWHREMDNLGKYVCKYCDLSYSTVQTLRHHVKVKHTHYYNNIKNTPINSRRQYKLKCHICKETFENINDLQIHSLTHGLNNTQNSCLLCLATFKEHNDLLSHMTNKHESLKKLHVCTTCGYNTSKSSNYKKHLKVHTGENKKKCTYCDYTTNYLPNMRIHERIHNNEKPYICGYKDCDYCCKTVSALRSHQLIHNKEKHMLYCDRCSYRTVYKINLKKHIETHQRKKFSEKIRSNDLGFKVS